eukprot:1534237-Amphidinium_carterae.1
MMCYGTKTIGCSKLRHDRIGRVRVDPLKPKRLTAASTSMICRLTKKLMCLRRTQSNFEGRSLHVGASEENYAIIKGVSAPTRKRLFSVGAEPTRGDCDAHDICCKVAAALTLRRNRRGIDANVVNEVLRELLHALLLPYLHCSNITPGKGYPGKCPIMRVPGGVAG